jgi:hypothetical protein
MSDMTDPSYAGIWMTETAPLAYRVLPKCGCSSIGQVMHYIDHRRFHEGSIHDPGALILKWGLGRDEAEIGRRFAAGGLVSFTLARNPYRRVLSSFADKILGRQPDGTPYRAGLLHDALSAYGVSAYEETDQRRLFSAFMRMVEDGLSPKRSAPADIHWASCASHLRYTFRHAPSWRLDVVGHVEHIEAHLDTALTAAGVDPDRRPASVPRENTTAKPDRPIEDFFGDAEVAIMQRIYREDFALFCYAEDPAIREPTDTPDLERLHATLAQ